MRHIGLLFLLFVLILTSCSKENNNDKASPGTPSVTKDQAIELAKTSYKLNSIEDAIIRPLEKWEIETRPPMEYSPNPIYYVIRGKDDKSQNVLIYVSSQNIEHHFKFIDNLRSIHVNVISSEKKLPQNYDEIVFKRQMVPYYEYLVIKAENDAEFDLVWNQFNFTPKDRLVNFSEKQVFFISVRESSSCPYNLGDIKTNPTGTELNVSLIGAGGGECTSDASPKTFVIEVNIEDSKNFEDVVIKEAGIKTKVPIYNQARH